MIFPNPNENVYIVFHLSHTHLEVPVTNNIEAVTKSIEEGKKAGIGRIVVPLSEIKYFIQKTPHLMIIKFKDDEKLEVLCTIEQVLKVLGNQKEIREMHS